jgi:hypothetical protein
MYVCGIYAYCVFENMSWKFIVFTNTIITTEGRNHHSLSIYKSECMYVCMFWHNYLSVNGIVSFSSFT